MTLVSFWFIVLVVFWTGFLVLEGFDFGVGMLHGVVGRDEQGRRLAIRTIGPLWDGNEVWLIVAAAGTFAAFPGWYATMFSGFYLAFVLLLVALIARGVSFEFRGKRDSPRWRRAWDAATTGGSLLAPLLIGVALGNLLHGVPIGTDQEYAGTFSDLLNPYSLFTGVTVVVLCLLHGASFLTLKTAGALRERAVRAGRRIAPVAAAVVLGFAVWTQVMAGEWGRYCIRVNAVAPGVQKSSMFEEEVRRGVGDMDSILEAVPAARSRPPRWPWRPSWCRSSSTCIRGSWSPPWARRPTSRSPTPPRRRTR